jgi:RNA polymerase sigma-70 factor (ECF subfamily)
MKQAYFDRVYERTYRTLLRYAIVHLSDPTDAEDALQDVYVDFYRRIEQRGHADILSPQAFLLKMLKREIVRRYVERSERRAFEVYDADEAEAADPLSFEDVAETRMMAGQVLETAKQLSPDSYRVFVLYYGFQMSVAEIARETQLGAEAVKSRLFRARNEIRRRLTGQAAARSGKEKRQ